MRPGSIINGNQMLSMSSRGVFQEMSWIILKKWDRFIRHTAYTCPTTIANVDDAIQEAKMHIISSLRKYKGNIKDVDKYVGTIIKNSILSQKNYTKFVATISTTALLRLSKDRVRELTKDGVYERCSLCSELFRVELMDMLDFYDKKGIVRLYLVEGYDMVEISKKLK